jgi:hypothetical protein
MHNVVVLSRWSLGTGALVAVVGFGLIGLVINLLKLDEHITFQNDTYIEECGACHVVYPPGLLPNVSWQKIMSDLSNHFEDNAELDQETALAISQYLAQHALRKGRPSTMSEMLRNIPDDPPIRITELPAFIAAHDDIAAEQQSDSSKGVYLSRCEACHADAETGQFDEDSLLTPSS